MELTDIKRMFYALEESYQFFKSGDDDTKANIWLTVLKGYTPEMARVALLEWISNESKEPTMADVKRLCDGLVRASGKRTGELTAEEAWEQCMKAAERGLDWSQFSHRFRKRERLLRAAKFVGWDRIRYADLSTEIHFVRRDFLSAYQAYTSALPLEPTTTRGKQLASKLSEMIDEQRERKAITESVETKRIADDRTGATSDSRTIQKDGHSAA